MEHFGNFIQSLKNYELLTLFTFRKHELSPKQIIKINSEISSRNIDLNNIEKIKEKYIEENYTAQHCPSCYCTTIEAFNEEKLKSFGEFWIRNQFAPWELKRKFHCVYCNHNYKKWISLSEIIALLKNNNDHQ